MQDEEKKQAEPVVEGQPAPEVQPVDIKEEDKKEEPKEEQPAAS